MSFRILYNWYSNIKIHIKWDGLGKVISVCKGTKQGGLSSPYLFNIFYKNLIDVLSNHVGAITIGNHRLYTFCYADDIVLTSTTPHVLQNMITTAVNINDKYVLSFNPQKNRCFIYGKCPFYVTPKWHINNIELNVSENITYLGLMQ